MAAYTAIDDPEAYFQVKAYTGNGSTQSITLDGDTDLQPDLNWIKCRSAAENHIMSDSVRGVSAGWGNFVLNPNVTSQQYGGTGLSAAGTAGFIPVSTGRAWGMQAIDGGTYS